MSKLYDAWQKSGRTIRDLSKHSGIPRATVWRVIRQPLKAQFGTVVDVARVLSVDIALLTQTEKEPH